MVTICLKNKSKHVPGWLKVNLDTEFEQFSETLPSAFHGFFYKQRQRKSS